MNYNTKIIEYNNSVTIKRYKAPIIIKSERQKMIDKLERQKIKEILKQQGYIKQLTHDSIERSNIVSLKRTKETIYSLARANKWDMFITLTFNPNLVNRTNYDEITEKLHIFLKKVKQSYAPELVYLLIPELHKDGKSYHFHGLLKNLGKLNFTNSNHITKNGQTVYHWDDYYLGFSDCILVNNSGAISGYITKYITKELCAVTKNKKRYWCSKNITRPKETVVNCDLEDYEMIIDSIGIPSYSKTVKFPVAHNSVNIMQIDF